MLTFAEKLKIIDSFPQLLRKDVSLGRVNFHYEESVFDKKIVVYHLHPNGNGFIYAGQIEGVPADDKGFVNIREYGEEELRSLVTRSIESLSAKNARTAGESDPDPETSLEERWTGPNQATLVVKYEDELWYVFSGKNLECAFETHEEVEEYMQEEGFRRL